MCASLPGDNKVRIFAVSDYHQTCSTLETVRQIEINPIHFFHFKLYLNPFCDVPHRFHTSIVPLLHLFRPLSL